MGISVVCEQTVEERHLQSLYGKFAWQAGLVIGRVTPKKHFVVTLLPTPQDINNATTNDDDDDDDADELPLDFGPPKGSFAKDLDVQLAVIQAENVRQALPGGLDIIGVYVFGPPTDANTTKLRTLLYAVCASSVVDQFSEISQQSKMMERVAVHFCSKTKKLTCRSYDINDLQASARPGSWKYMSFVHKWQKISCDFDANIDVSVAITNTPNTTNTPLIEAVKEALEPTLQHISSSQLVLPNKTSDKEIKGTLFCKRQTRQCITNTTTSSSSSSSTTTTPHGKAKEKSKSKAVCANLSIVGTIKAIAYLPPKSTPLESKLAVQSDIERSLLARCSVICNTLDEDDTDPGCRFKSQKLSLPSRVSIPFVNPIHISHYCADVDEQQDLSECCVMLKNFFDMQIDIADVVFHERIVDTPAISKQTKAISTGEKASKQETKSDALASVRGGDGDNDGGGMQMVVPAVVFAVVAVVIGLYLALS